MLAVNLHVHARGCNLSSLFSCLCTFVTRKVREFGKSQGRKWFVARLGNEKCNEHRAGRRDAIDVHEEAMFSPACAMRLERQRSRTCRSADICVLRRTQPFRCLTKSQR